MPRLRVVLALPLIVAAVGCARTVDLTGSPRPFVPRDTLVARAASVSAAGINAVTLTVADGAAYVVSGPSDSVRVSLVVGKARLAIDPRRRSGG